LPLHGFIFYILIRLRSGWGESRLLRMIVTASGVFRKGENGFAAAYAAACL
jgi:hypothetical protein